MKNKLKFLLAPSLMFLPALVLAQGDGINRLIDQFQVLVMRLVPIVIGLALLVFLWGVLRYLFSKDDTAKGEARNFMMWGIVALFVMVSVWGIVTILSQTIFGTTPIDVPPTTPKVPGTR
jgi:hypothetical protein